MKKVDQEYMDKLCIEIAELQKEIKGLRDEYEKKDTERYNEWNKIMGYYSNKIEIIQTCINTRYKELNRLEKLKDHRKHEWIKDPLYNWETEQLKFPIQERYKCDVCGKTKMRKVKLEKIVNR
jgi:hypothetical protein